MRSPFRSPAFLSTRRGPAAIQCAAYASWAPYAVSVPIARSYSKLSSKQIHRERASLWSFRFLSSGGWAREASCIGVGSRAPLRGAVRISGLLRSAPCAFPGARRLRWRGVATLVTRLRCAAPGPVSGSEVVPPFSFPANLAVSPLCFRSTGARCLGASLRSVSGILSCPCYVRLPTSCCRRVAATCGFC